MAVEALVVGTAASVAGLFLGLGFARGLGALFDAAGMGIPRGAMELAPRTIVIALSVGIGVTLARRDHPGGARDARRRRSPRCATRRRPRAPRHPRSCAASPRSSSRSPGSRSSLQGLLGGGTATARLGAMGAGTLLVFIGVAASARYIVRPLAAISAGRSSASRGTTGELARENASRNPAAPRSPPPR